MSDDGTTPEGASSDSPADGGDLPNPQPVPETPTWEQASTQPSAAAATWRPPEVLDSDLTPRHRGRQVGAVTAALVAAVVAVLAFAGGVLVQRSQGGGSTPIAAGAGQFPGGGSRFSQGGAPGEGGTPGGRDGFGTPVSGTVVKVGNGTLTVKKQDGTEVRITVPSDVQVTTSTTRPLSSLTSGTSVTVLGSTGSDGTVTARSVIEGALGGGFFRGGSRPTTTPTTGG